MTSRWESAFGRTTVLAVLLLAAAAALLARPAGADAARGITLGFAEPRYASVDPGVRDFWFDKGEESGGEWARVGIGWRGIAPNEPANTTNPSSPGYFFAGPDAAIRDADARGMDVLLTVGFAPDWAEGPGRPSTSEADPGTWKPDPGKLADFATALATRYSGNFPDPLNPGKTLPKVSRFEVWNESNLAQFLTPQVEGGENVAADHYRKMLNAFYGAAHAVQSKATVVAGSLSPIGSDGSGGASGRARVGPLEFLRELLCVKGKTGKKKKPFNCGQTTKLDALSHHPINVNNPPTKPAGKDDAGISEMGDIVDILRAAEKGGNVSGGKHPVWATEFWWHSNPPKKGKGTPSLTQQANFIQEALYILWQDKVELAMLYQVGDEKGSPFQTGILFDDGKPKPAQTAYRFPLVGDRKSKKKVNVWGRAPSKGKVQIQVKGKKGGFKTAKKIKVKPGSVFQTKVKLKGKGKIKAKLGKDKSLTWKQSG